MRKTQHRTPPPPTNLTVIYKIEYGEVLQYKHPNGVVQKFEQWKSYPADAQNLVTFTNEQLADGNNYQYATKPLASAGFDPVDIPILYMTGDYDFTLNRPRWRTCASSSRRAARSSSTRPGAGKNFPSPWSARCESFPKKSFMRLPLDHPIFNVRFRLKDVTMRDRRARRRCTARGLHHRHRHAGGGDPGAGGLGAALSGTDYHKQGRHVVGESAKRLGINLVAYMLGNTEYGRFLAQDFPMYDGRTRAGDLVRFAAVRYNGSWDLNPAVQNSLLSGLKENTGVDVDYNAYSVALDDKQTGHFPLLFMTGHYDFQLTDAETAGLSRYLQRGGLLVASAGAGLKPFDAAFKREMKKVLPKGEMVKLTPSHPLFAGGFNAVDRVTYTPYTTATLRDGSGLDTPEFYGYFLDGRLAIIYSPYDLMSGANREANPYAKGLIDSDALRMTNNIITYALSH